MLLAKDPAMNGPRTSEAITCTYQTVWSPTVWETLRLTVIVIAMFCADHFIKVVLYYNTVIVTPQSGCFT